jgi:hypothetical protein
LIVLPLATIVFFGIGYASVTTLSIAITVTVIFLIRHAAGLAPLPDVFYGVIAFGLLAWALRPNIRALIQGQERFHGLRPWRSRSTVSATGFPSAARRRGVDPPEKERTTEKQSDAGPERP